MTQEQIPLALPKPRQMKHLQEQLFMYD